jgi:hypothetical protein
MGARSYTQAKAARKASLPPRSTRSPCERITRSRKAGGPRDNDEPTAFEALLLDLLSEGEQSAEEIVRELDAHMVGVIGTHRARPERGH